MNSNSFNLSSRFTQRELIWKKGIFLASYQSCNFTYILYQLEQFYVEEMRDTASGFVFNFRGLENTSVPDRYLVSIDVSDIYDNTRSKSPSQPPLRKGDQHT